MKTKIVLFFIIVLLSNFMFAQTANNENLKNRHSIGLYGGFKGNSQVAVSAIPTITDMKTGFMGGIEYGYWFADEWQVGLSAGLVAANSNLHFVNVESNAVIAVLFGFKYYPANLKLGEVGRVYASFFAGPYVGMAQNESGMIGSVKTITETVIGGQAGVGIDLFVARWLKIGPALNYNFMGDLNEIAGEKKNFSGLAFVVNYGIVL
jgi:hypothetical protein